MNLLKKMSLIHIKKMQVKNLVKNVTKYYQNVFY